VSVSPLAAVAVVPPVMAGVADLGGLRLLLLLVQLLDGLNKGFI
jgi:hypothetical protein